MVNLPTFFPASTLPMSAKYQAPFVIPEDFPALLKAFTREVLRTQVSVWEA